MTVVFNTLTKIYLIAHHFTTVTDISQAKIWPGSFGVYLFTTGIMIDGLPKHYRMFTAKNRISPISNYHSLWEGKKKMHQFVTKQPHTQQASEMSAMCEHHFLAKQLLATGKQKNRMTNACLSSVLRRNRGPFNELNCTGPRWITALHSLSLWQLTWLPTENEYRACCQSQLETTVPRMTASNTTNRYYEQRCLHAIQSLSPTSIQQEKEHKREHY